MSNPPNPLAKFRTYSYHHVMAICDCTDTALELSESPTFTDVFTARASVDRLKVLETGTGGKYIILIDGFADAQFVIQSVKWATTLSPDPLDSLSSTVETDGEMTILEPQGVRFMNELAKACSSLASDPTGLIFVLKTFFIGHTDTGETELISAVRPLFFILIDVKAEFSETGATYQVAYVGMCNGGAKLPYVNDIASQVDITNTTSDGKVVTTLGEVFGKVLKEKVKRLYDDEWARVKTLYQELGIQGDVNDNYRQVTYEFDLDPEYAAYTFGTNEKLGKHNNINDPILSFSAHTTFENIIEGIMMSSAEVAKEADNPTDKYLFKITSSIESSQDEYKVVYHINRYRQSTPTIDEAVSVSGGARFVPPEGSLIEFDYIFTGKNIDIKQFDIKMEQGLAFFQLLSTTSTLPNQSESMSVSQRGIGKGEGGGDNSKANPERNPKARNKTPLFLGGQTRDALIRNKKNAVSTINFKSMMARWSALENIQAKMTIAGNPQLLDEMSVAPSDLRNRKTEDVKTGETINPSWMKLPSFVRVNIMMPSYEMKDDFAEAFWFDGYYQLFFINNIFDDGVFTQELEMFSIPYGDFSDKVSDDIRPGSTTESSGRRRAGGPGGAGTGTAGAIGSSSQDVAAAAAKFIAEEEGYPNKGKAYWDPPNQRDKVAIGYGHRITPTEMTQGYIDTAAGRITLKGNRGIDTVVNRLQAQKLLEKDIPEYESRAKQPLGASWDKLASNQKVSLISYAYNVGNTAGLAKNGLVSAIDSGDTAGGANIIRNGATTVNGQRSAGLVTRRDKEADLFESSPIPNQSSGTDASPTQYASVPPAQDPDVDATTMTVTQMLQRVT